MSITAYARDIILQAKEVAESMRYLVIGMYVDCLWICKPGDKTVADFQSVLDAINDRTGLPIALDGVFKWLTFLPSRMESRISVPNRYFGVFQNGELKIRALRQGQVKVDQLLVRLRLTRALDEYKGNSAASRAARQLAEVGKNLSAGDSVRFLYTRGKPSVSAWDLPETPDLRNVNLERYTVLLLRAAASALTPLNLNEFDLAALVAGCIPMCLPFDLPQSRTNGAMASIINLTKFGALTKTVTSSFHTTH
jgi:DNA polymerase II